MSWLAAGRGPSFAGYEDLWQWSVTDPGAFWGTVWDYFEVLGDRGEPDADVLTGAVMPDVRWFAGATLNYARNALRTAWTDPDRTALIYSAERRHGGALTYAELAERVARVARGLRALGVRRGDRVAALLPNVPEAIIGLLATASLGAIWSSCSPDFGARSVIDRFAQIEPTVLIACDGYTYAGKDFSRIEMLGDVVAALPGLSAVVLVDVLAPGGRAARGGDPPDSWGEASVPLPPRPPRPPGDQLGRPGRRAGPERAGVRGGAVRSSAVGGVLLGHDGPAEAHHARPRRDRPRAPQGDRLPPGPQARRRVHLVHHDRLDDVELPGRRAAGRADHRALRRERHLPGHEPAVAAGRRARDHATWGSARPTWSPA